MASRNGPRAPKTDAPEHVRAAKLELRALGVAERKVRKRWTDARAEAIRISELDGAVPLCLFTERQAGGIGVLTLALWAAEQAREQSAARWRILLAERETMPVDRRWNLADLEAWASWSPGVV